MYLKAGALAVTLLLVFFGDVSGSCEADNHVNGCSVPLGVPFPYKDQFKSACNKHDVCYFCGQMYGWSRSACDKSFKKDMESICDSLYANGRKRSSWTDFYNAAKLAVEIGKWPAVSPKVAHCKQGAKIYYMAVDYFGQDNYENNSPSWCNHVCSVSKGNPQLSLKK